MMLAAILPPLEYLKQIIFYKEIVTLFLRIFLSKPAESPARIIFDLSKVTSSWVSISCTTTFMHSSIENGSSAPG